MIADIEDKLKQAGLCLPEAPSPAGSYMPVSVVGRTVYVSGQISKMDSEVISGKLGKGLSLEDGQNAARIAALNAISVLKRYVGLDKISRFVKLTGFVNADEGFQAIPLVVNGASDLLVALWGEKGKHSRSAVGVSSLPLGAAVEIEMIVELEQG